MSSGTGSKAVIDEYFLLAIALVCVSSKSVGKTSQKYFLENVSIHMSVGIDHLLTLERKRVREEDGMKISI